MRGRSMRAMKNPGVLLVLSIVVAIGTVVPGSARAVDTIKIGVGGPMTGSEAKFGEQLARGAKAAVEAINAAGGIHGAMLEIVTGDDACDPKQAQSVANSLVNSKVHVVIGHFCSSSTIPASAVYAENNLLNITPASTNPLVTERKLPTVFRTCGRDDQQGSVAADYLVGKLKPKAIAIIHDKTTYGQGLADATKARLNGRHKVQEVLYEGINKGDKDFNSLVTKMKGLKVDAIFFGGYHTEAGLIVRQAFDQGLKAKFVSGDALVTEEFSQVVGKPEAAAGTLMTFGADATRYPEAKTVVEKFRKEGYNPEGYTLYTYAAVQVVAAALKANGNTRDGKKLADWIRKHPVTTAMGKKEFDDKGDLKVSDYVMYGWVNEGGKVTYRQL
jgi:branched-chain amino acid transport system substrate-binding protein